MMRLEDLAAGRETAPAMLVSMAAPRLEAVGIDVPDALIRRIVSFARAAEQLHTP
jgi:hypothetical protein